MRLQGLQKQDGYRGTGSEDTGKGVFCVRCNRTSNYRVNVVMGSTRLQGRYYATGGGVITGAGTRWRPSAWPSQHPGISRAERGGGEGGAAPLQDLHRARRNSRHTCCSHLVAQAVMVCWGGAGQTPTPPLPPPGRHQAPTSPSPLLLPLTATTFTAWLLPPPPPPAAITKLNKQSALTLPGPQMLSPTIKQVQGSITHSPTPPWEPERSHSISTDSWRGVGSTAPPPPILPLFLYDRTPQISVST